MIANCYLGRVNVLA